ncbi:MAG: hypothetical protein HZA66_18835 [Rhodopseudomonas palustris]|uniref:Uncharacterized protein n=1 Tax=Rhodopseudomonas palustris TaxID=1076 RepID=A0A933W3R9_RHOPL|nr:hypothetical protein [Rhodopseudomonas palustris]
MIDSPSVPALPQSGDGFRRYLHLAGRHVASKPGGITPACQTCTVECGTGRAAAVGQTYVRIDAAPRDDETFHFQNSPQRRVVSGSRLSANEAAVCSAFDLAQVRSTCGCKIYGARCEYKADFFVQIDGVDALACEEA